MRPLIVGIDPGTTVGVAILDFEGDLIKIYSKKHFSLNSIVKFITSFGSVVVIATDVHKIPASISKLSAEVGAVIFNPEKNIYTSEKIRLTKKYVESRDIKIKNAHERAALIAALLAYYFYQNKINQTKKKLREKNLTEEQEATVFEKVVKGTSIEKTIKAVL